MTALAATVNLVERLWDLGTTLVDRDRSYKTHMIDSTKSGSRSSGDQWTGEIGSAGPTVDGKELIATNFSFHDLFSDLTDVFVEATSTAESIAVWVGELVTGVASPDAHADPDYDVLIDVMLPRMPLSIEPIRLQVEFVEPRFQWSNEVEIDPFDELD